jgi:hypothetical protein
MVCSGAAAGGHLEVLKWARDNGCPWDEETCSEAVESGHLEILKYLRSQGCPWDAWACLIAAEGGHLEILKWIYEQGDPWSRQVYTRAAYNGHLEILKWAWGQCKFDITVALEAVYEGHLDVIEWGLQHGCHWTYTASKAAARFEHTHILKWIRDNGYCLGGAASYDALFKDGQYCRYIGEPNDPADLVRFISYEG